MTGIEPEPTRCRVPAIAAGISHPHTQTQTHTGSVIDQLLDYRVCFLKRKEKKRKLLP